MESLYYPYLIMKRLSVPEEAAIYRTHLFSEIN